MIVSVKSVTSKLYKRLAVLSSVLIILPIYAVVTHNIYLLYGTVPVVAFIMITNNTLKKYSLLPSLGIHFFESTKSWHTTVMSNAFVFERELLKHHLVSSNYTKAIFTATEDLDVSLRVDNEYYSINIIPIDNIIALQQLAEGVDTTFTFLKLNTSIVITLPLEKVSRVEPHLQRPFEEAYIENNVVVLQDTDRNSCRRIVKHPFSR